MIGRMILALALTAGATVLPVAAARAQRPATGGKTAPASPAPAAHPADAGATPAPLPLGEPPDATPTTPAAADPFAGIDASGAAPAPEAGATPAPLPPPDDAAAPPRDPDVERVQGAPAAPAGPVAETNPLGPAKEPPGGAAVPAGEPGTPFIPSAKALPEEPSQVGLLVAVVAPEVVNLHVPNTFRVQVKNTGPGEAVGAVVRYPLPENVEFVEAEPPPTSNAAGVYFWQINGLPAGAEKSIRVTVKPTAKGTFDHAVTVALTAGTRARTIVRQPQLKAEVRPARTKPLKGTPLGFEIVVTNEGDHPARDVTLHAKLSPGLWHPKGTDLYRSLKDDLGIAALAPGQKEVLQLQVETRGVGPQSCEVAAASPDVPAETTARADVEVVAPELKLTIDGPGERYPDNVASYKITVANSGTAPAKDVMVAAKVPSPGRNEAARPRATWVDEAKTYYWRVAEMAPGASEEFTVQVRMGSIGLFTLQAGVKAQGVAVVSRNHNTEIKGLSNLILSVSEPRGVLDEGEESTFELRISNRGSKEAEAVLVKALVSDNLKVLALTGVDGKEIPQASPNPAEVVFPQVDRLAPGTDVTLTFRVQAVRAGNGTCNSTVTYDTPPVSISQSTVTRVTSANAAPPR